VLLFAEPVFQVRVSVRLLGVGDYLSIGVVDYVFVVARAGVLADHVLVAVEADEGLPAVEPGDARNIPLRAWSHVHLAGFVLGEQSSSLLGLGHELLRRADRGDFRLSELAFDHLKVGKVLNPVLLGGLA
jgi:hypothetical protein